MSTSILVASIDDLKDKIQNASKEKPFVLDKAVFSLPCFQRLFEKIEEIRIVSLVTGESLSGLCETSLLGELLTGKIQFYSSGDEVSGYILHLDVSTLGTKIPILERETDFLSTNLGFERQRLLILKSNEEDVLLGFGIRYLGLTFECFPSKSSSADLQLKVEFESKNIESIDSQLQKVLGATYQDWIPDSIRKNIQLSEVNCRIDPRRGGKFLFFTFGLKVPDWELAKGHFSLEKNHVYFTISRRDAKVIDANLASSLCFERQNGTPIEIKAITDLREDGYSIEAKLTNSIDLNQISFFHASGFNFPKIDQLIFRYEKKGEGTFTLCTLEVSNFTILKDVIVFSKAILSIEHTNSYSISAQGYFDLGGANVFLGCQFSNGKWSFVGAVSNISFQDFSDFASKQGIKIPEAISSMVIKKMKLAYSDGFAFDLTDELIIGEARAFLTIHLDAKSAQGKFQIDKMVFTGSFKDRIFEANWKGKMKLSEFISHIGSENISEFGKLDVEITAIALTYNFESKDWGFEIDLGTTKFYVQAEGEKYSIGFEMADFSIDQLPAIGKIPAAIAPKVKGLQVAYSSVEGFAFSGNLQIGTEKPIPIAPTEKNVETHLPAKSEEKTKWIPIKKVVGTLNFERIGVEFQDGKLGFLVDLSIQGGGLTISAIGIKVESPITSFAPELSIQGLGIDFKQGPIEMAGGLVHRDDEFMGNLIITTPTFSIKAIGSYSEVEGNPSLFVFAHLSYPLGGPPFFFVTGLAAGFGFNRQLKVPGVNEVANFPFVKWVVNKNPPESIGAVISNLASSGIVSPAFGTNWLAFGVQFTVFKLIDAFALAILKFGSRVEMDLLGLATLILPDKNLKYVKAELQIKATFIPDEGILGIAGSLTKNSFVFHPDCHITGGFAYFTWLKGPHSGDFVVTMGGYGKKFRPPGHYPQVSPLGLSWKIGALNIQGSLYFAMTPKALMAGGYLSAVWKSGGIRAWFNVQADFLMYYSPFQFYLAASISLGASFEIDLWITTVTISIHLGVALVIQGPEFYGTAKIDLSIISFTIAFGERKNPENYLGWNEFSDKYIPKKEGKFFDFQIVKGLIKEEKGQNVVDGERLECLFSTGVPVINALTIGPMGNKKLSSTIKPTIQKDNEAFSGLTLLENSGKIPSSLWGPQDIAHKRPSGDPTKDSVIPNIHVGYKITPTPRSIPKKTEKKNLEDFFLEKNECNLPWSIPAFSKEEKGAADLSKINAEKINKSIQSLGEEFAFLLSDIEVSELAEGLLIPPVNQPIGIDDRGLHV